MPVPPGFIVGWLRPLWGGCEARDCESECEKLVHGVWRQTVLNEEQENGNR